MSGNLLGALALFLLVGAIVLLGRRSGRVELERDVAKAGQDLERKASDAINKAPADPPAVVDWLRDGGRDG